MRGSNFVDRSGVRYGRLVALSRAPDIQISERKRVAWKCICDCGNEAIVRAEHLQGGRINSCGCLKKEMVGLLKFKHGEARKGEWSAEFRAWCGAKSRCYDKNSKNYRYYGGRGIKMADEWINDFQAFLEHVGRKPHKGLSLDRIDVDGDYAPGNLRWATWHEQRMNQRCMKK